MTLGVRHPDDVEELPATGDRPAHRHQPAIRQVPDQHLRHPERQRQQAATSATDRAERHSSTTVWCSAGSRASSRGGTSAVDTRVSTSSRAAGRVRPAVHA